MKNVKLIAVDKLEKMEFIENEIKEYSMFYNEMVRKNNLLYELYIKNKHDIKMYEIRYEVNVHTYEIYKLISKLDKKFKVKCDHLKKNTNMLNDILNKLYELEDKLLDMHVDIYNAMNDLKK